MTARNASILVVDDEPLLANTLAVIFQRAGYTASAVYSGEEALSSIAAHPPSLIVADVVMSGMDGVALAKIVRMSYPNCQVLLFSGNAETQDLLEAAEHEGYAFEILAKPVPPLYMLAKVASLLDQSSSPL